MKGKRKQKSGASELRLPHLGMFVCLNLLLRDQNVTRRRIKLDVYVQSIFHEA